MAYDTVVKSSSAWGGVQGLQAHPKKFSFAENLGKSPESPGKNSAQRCSAAKNGAQDLHKYTWKPFSGVTPKTGLHDLYGRKFVGKSCPKNFSGKFGEIKAKSFAHPKFACSCTYDEKAPPPPLPLFWKDRGGNALAEPLFSGVPVHIILHALSLLIVVSYNVSLQWT